MNAINDVLPDLHVTFCGQSDMADLTTIIPYLYLLHDYWEYTLYHPAPICLVAPLDSNNKVSTIGKGFLNVSSEDVSRWPTFECIR